MKVKAMPKYNLFFIILASIILTACAGPSTRAPNISNQALAVEKQKQKNLLYKAQIDNQNRLYNISYPILTKNFEACNENLRPLYGMVMWNLTNVAKSYRKAAKELYGLSNRVSVRTVAKNSPAHKAGIKAGDVLIAINGTEIPEGKLGIKFTVKELKNGSNGPVKIAIGRNGKIYNKTIAPVKGCKYPVLMNKSPSLNAFADGKKIVISKGMMRFLENDNELALVISHELAHNAMLHIDKKRQNATVGVLGGTAVDVLLAAAGVNSGGQFSQLGESLGAKSYSVEFEQEADYVGMYFMARAGYNTKNVANFWRRLAAEGNSSIDRRTSHPTSPERFLSIEKTHLEIINKKRKGQKLVPNTRE